MSRTQSQGLDFFPFAVDFFSDKKVQILKARYGADGIAILVYLLCQIYREGYYTRVDEDTIFIISEELHISTETVQQVLTFLLKRSMFNEQVFKSDTILTSDGIQERWQKAVSTRAAKTPIEVSKYWLLKAENTRPFIKCTLYDNNSEKKDNNFENYSQSKVKKSKEEYIEKEIYKEKERKRPDKPVKHKYGLYKNVLLSDEDMQKLQAEFPDYKERIERLSEYMDYKGTKYKNHLSTIRAWARKDEQAKKASAPVRGNIFLDLYEDESGGF